MNNKVPSINKNTNKKWIIKRNQLLVLVFAITILLTLNPKTIKAIKGAMGGKEGKVTTILELELPHSSQILYNKFNEHLLKYWDGILYSYNINGSQNWSINLGVTNPIIEVNETNIYIVDASKNQIIKINNKGETIYRTVLEKKIGFVKSGDDLLLIYHASEKNAIRNITILNEKGKKIGEILVSEGEVINGAISGEHEKIVLHTMGTHGGKLEGKLIQYNLKGEIIRLDSTKENIIIDMRYDHKGNLITIYEEEIFSYNINQQENWKLETDKIKQIINTEELITVFSGKEGSGGIIQGRSREKITIIDLDGNVIAEKTLSENISGIDSHKNDLLVNSDRSIFLLNKKGDIIMEHKFSTDIDDVFILPQRHMAIITKEKLIFTKIK